MDENIYGAETQQAINDQLNNLSQSLSNQGSAADAQEPPQDSEIEHYQPPFLRDDQDDTDDVTYKDAEQSLQNVGQQPTNLDNSNVVAAPNLPNLNLTPTPTPPIPVTVPAAVNTDATSSQLPPLPVPKDRKESLEMQIEKDRRDADAWLEFIAYLESQGRNLVGEELETWWMEYTRVYDEFFKIWPCAVRLLLDTECPRVLIEM